MIYGDSIYLDYAATTPLDPDVLAAMLPWLSGAARVGNASSIHRAGRQARAALDQAREQVAHFVGADYADITFTGSGTEADNLALLGTLRAAAPGRNHLVTTAMEHHAVLHPARWLQTQGFEVAVVTPEKDGLIAPERIAEAVTERTALVSVMHANNEIGTIQPIAEIAAIAHECGAKFHTDAVQTAPFLPLDVDALGCDLLTLSAHKLYGPQGVGALYVRPGTALAPLIQGGAQERERRAGTENVAGIVGFGAATVQAQARRQADAERLARLRDAFLSDLRARIPDLRLNGHPTLRLANNVNVSVPGVEGPSLLMNLDRQGIAASSGSACSSGSIEPSHVLLAIGLSPELASSGVRFSLGRETREADLHRTAEIFTEIVTRLRPR